MEVIVLAGGMGTRLRSVVNNLPKPMAPVNDQPFLKYLLEWVTQYNVSRITLAVGYLGNVIKDYFGDEFKGIILNYSYEEKALGTGGGIFLALNRTAATSVLVINGDTYFPVNLDEFYAFHINQGGDVSIALKPMVEFDRYGTVECDGSNVLKFNEKQYCKNGTINGGIYAINKQGLANKSLPEVFSFETEILEKTAGTGKLKAMVFDEPFIDIGIPEDYKRATEFL